MHILFFPDTIKDDNLFAQKCQHSNNYNYKMAEKSYRNVKAFVVELV